MNLHLTKTSIKQWCGASAYQKGERLSRANHVRFMRFQAETGEYAAEVSGTSRHEVSVAFHGGERPQAACDCPSLDSFRLFCHHIAAVLIRLNALQQTNVSPAASLLPRIQSNIDLADRIVRLFDEKPVRPMHNKTLTETRTPLETEFILKLLALDDRTALFGLALKVGPKQRYIVRNLGSFLDVLEGGEGYSFTAAFSYDPELHCFAQEDEAVLRALIDMTRDQAAYREAIRLQSVYAAGIHSDRMVLITPKSWSVLLPLLAQAQKAKLVDGSRTYERIQLSEEPLPLRFDFLQAEAADAYELRVRGIDQITILEPYAMVLLDGKLVPLPAKQCRRLAELKAILSEPDAPVIPIRGGQAAAFLEKALPGFKKLGAVHIDPAVAERVTQVPLRAKLFLDRVRDRLLAAVEFHYGTFVIHPLADSRNDPDAQRILIRDAEAEQQILALLEQNPFVKTEGGYILSDEEAEFHFLYTVVPQLEKLARVYATTAVKLRIQKLDGLPKALVHVSADERLNWLEFRLNMGWIPETEIRELVKSLEEKRRYYRLPSGSLMPLDSAELQQLAAFLNETGFLHSDIAESKITVPLVRGLPLLDQPSDRVKLDKPVRQLLDNLRNPDNLDFPLPDGFADVLRGYQKLGVQWMRTLAHYGFGGILADDMGLGKTVQCIAFIASELPDIRRSGMPALVVSPGSLVYNWLGEFKKFAPDIRVRIADGTKPERAKKLQSLMETDVVITSYPLLLRDAGRYGKLSFHTLILDEAQTFKNHATQTARAVKNLRARYRFALTGTPIENRLEELWSIFHVVFPQLFQDRKTFGNFTHKEIARRARPFMLRRWKSEVLQDLPDKLEFTKFAELLPEQKKLYAAYLAKLQQETLKHLSEDGYTKSRIKILAGLTRLRQICCHPALFVEGYKGGSAKLEQLLEVVEECLANRKRMLIFSQFTEMLGMIGKALHEEGIPYFYLDGSTPNRERIELCDRFNDGEMDVFLISLKAGGTGLNVTGADTVILYDLWWNPAVEQQAADRAHRIGQKNVVQVIRLVMRDTMEEKMVELQHNKKRLIDEVMHKNEDAPATLTEQDIRDILLI